MKINVKKSTEQASKQQLAYVKRERAKSPPTPVREIAYSLGLSTQRIYKIIEKI